jgi:hypothetical protein
VAYARNGMTEGISFGWVRCMYQTQECVFDDYPVDFVCRCSVECDCSTYALAVED